MKKPKTKANWGDLDLIGGGRMMEPVELLTTGKYPVRFSPDKKSRVRISAEEAVRRIRKQYGKHLDVLGD